MSAELRLRIQKLEADVLDLKKQIANMIDDLFCSHCERPLYRGRCESCSDD